MSLGAGDGGTREVNPRALASYQGKKSSETGAGEREGSDVNLACLEQPVRIWSSKEDLRPCVRRFLLAWRMGLEEAGT